MHMRLLHGTTVAAALSMTAWLSAAPASAPVADASMRGDKDAVRTLLKEGAEVVTMLLDQGAEVDARESQWGQTPLIFAAAQNRVDAIKALLDYGADPAATTKALDLAKNSALDRAATALQRKVLDTTVPKGQQPTPTQ